ncbi:MAG: hypothetical protein IJL88_11765 [Clostridia bacterium]|nr:hypothetical protein [Clostridia bacterium]
MLLVLLGAVNVYGSSKLAGLFLRENPNGALIIKGVGCALAVAGALWLFMT